MNLNSLRAFAGSARARWVTLICGALLVTAFAPFQQYWLAPLLLAGLLSLWSGVTPRQAAWLGFFFGFGLFAAGTWWLYISLNILGGLWPPLAVLMMLALALALAAFSALAGYLTVRLAPTVGPSRYLLVFPAAWTIAEWLRGWVLTGFPWMSIGYSQAESPLGALAPVAGVYGVSWYTALLAGALVAVVLGNGRARLIAITCVVVSGLVIWPLHARQWTTETGQDFRVRLVQGSISQDQKWLPEQRQPTLDLYRELSITDAPLDLIVWPEAAIPALPFEVVDFVQELHEEMQSRDTQLFTGILTFDLETDEFYNTLWAIGAEEGQYHKRHLVPFGEYFPVPDFVRGLMRMMNLPSENVSAGPSGQAPLFAKGVPVAPTICYEIAYGAEQLEFFPEAQLMVNVSNDAWFGNTIAPHQHLQINQFRAREAGRYMLRATNTGVTAVIDPLGSVVSRIPQFEPGYLDAVVQPRTGQTPYHRFGDWPVVVLSTLLLLFMGWRASRNT